MTFQYHNQTIRTLAERVEAELIRRERAGQAPLQDTYSNVGDVSRAIVAAAVEAEAQTSVFGGLMRAALNEIAEAVDRRLISEGVIKPDMRIRRDVRRGSSHRVSQGWLNRMVPERRLRAVRPRVAAAGSHNDVQF